MLAKTGSTGGKARFLTLLFLWRFALVENKQKWRGLAAFDSFVAPSRPFTSEERPLGEEGGVK